MNDDFFSRFRQSPRPEFAQALYAKLTQDEKAQQITRRSSAVRRVSLALAVLCLAFTLTIAISPTVRAAVEDILAKITVRGITVFVSEEIPAPMQTGEGESYSEIWTPVSPDQITTDYPFFAKLPDWIPFSYVLQKRAALYYAAIYAEIPSSSLFEWKNNNGETIQLNVRRGSCPDGPSPDSYYMGPGCTCVSYFSAGLENEPQVIAVNDQPAILFRGVLGLADLSGTIRKWNPSRGKWDMSGKEGFTLTWENDGRTFTLITSSGTITREDFIHIAESIP